MKVGFGQSLELLVRVDLLRARMRQLLPLQQLGKLPLIDKSFNDFRRGDARWKSSRQFRRQSGSRAEPVVGTRQKHGALQIKLGKQGGQMNGLHPAAHAGHRTIPAREPGNTIFCADCIRRNARTVKKPENRVQRDTGAAQCDHWREGRTSGKRRRRILQGRIHGYEAARRGGNRWSESNRLV